MADLKNMLCQDIIDRNIHGQHIFMSKSNSDVFTLNETASFIFQSLGRVSSLAELTQEVMTEFAIDDMELAKNDIQTLLQTLLDRNILRKEAVDDLLK